MDSKTETSLILLGIGTFFFLISTLLLFDRKLMIGSNLIFCTGILALFYNGLETFNEVDADGIKTLSIFVIGCVLLLNDLSLFGFVLQCVSCYMMLRKKITVPNIRSLVRNNMMRIFKLLRFF